MSEPVRTIAVVGAGAMGAGLAQTAATAGFEVLLHDQSEAAAQRAQADIAARLRRLADKGTLSGDAAEAALARIRVVGDLAAFAGADLVVEAIVERLDVKQALFERLETIVGEEAVLASNTSALSIAAIGRGCRRRDRVCGMHFFNPVPLMKLVEVIRAPATSEATMERALDVATRLGKTPVRVADAPGFLVNLGNRAFITESLHLLHERIADAATIDRILRQAVGFRMGPFELMDLTGMDVNYPAARAMYAGYQDDPRLRTTPGHEALFNAGLFGRKTGRGHYDYAGDAGAAPVAAAPVSDAPPAHPLAAMIPEASRVFDRLAQDAGLSAASVQTADTPILVAPVGEDATAICARLGLDPARVVAIDPTGYDRRFLTLMAPPGQDGQAIGQVGDWLRSHGFEVAQVRDSAGFVAQRIVACVANLGCEMAQIGVGCPGDIDVAMTLGLNYPLGPLQLAEWLGVATTFRVMSALQAVTGFDRYRPSQWLRRRALLDLPIHTPD